MQHFKENPHFNDSVLKKEYKYAEPPASAENKVDENGISEAMLDFSWERDVKPSVCSDFLLKFVGDLYAFRPLKLTGKTPRRR